MSFQSRCILLEFENSIEVVKFDKSIACSNVVHNVVRMTSNVCVLIPVLFNIPT